MRLPTRFQGGFLAVGAIFAGCAGSPADAWVGRYDVFIEERQWPCDMPGGDPPPATSRTTWTFVRDDSGLYVAGMCRLAFHANTTTRAMLIPSTCRAVLEDGTLVDVELLTGVLTRDAIGFVGTLTSTARAADGRCVTSVAEIDATEL